MTDIVIDFINNMGIYGSIISCLLILVESILPVMPLCVFIIINFLAFGFIFGLLVSWIFTVIGCLISFWAVRNKLKTKFDDVVRKNKKINSLMGKVDKWKFNQLVVILAIPFTPAFTINIAAGLSKMEYKKFIIACLIGKFFMVFFWGYVGLSFVECLSNPIAIIKIVVMVLIAYIVSYVINKKFKID